MAAATTWPPACTGSPRQFVTIPPAASITAIGAATNTESLGQLIYTHYVFAFQAAGLILLVAMIGAIVLTHRTRPGVKKQRISDQVHRDPSETIEVRKVPPGQGI